jgi:hypothetical protein
MGVGILIPVRKPAGGQELNINTRTSLKRRHIRNIKLERFPPQVACQHGMPLGSYGFPRQLKTQFPAHRPTPQQYLPTECTRERTRCNGFIADLSSSRYNLSLCCYLRPAPRNGGSVTSPPGMSPILLVITACLMWQAELANDGCGLAACCLSRLGRRYVARSAESVGWLSCAVPQRVTLVMPDGRGGLVTTGPMDDRAVPPGCLRGVLG